MSQNDEPQQDRNWITSQEAAELGGYPDTSSVQYAAMRKSFRAEKVGGVWLIFKPDFERWLREDALGPRNKG